MKRSIVASAALLAVTLTASCATTDGTAQPPTATTGDDDESASGEDYDALIERAVRMTRDIRESWQRGEERDFEREQQALELYLHAAELRPDRVEGPYGAAVMLVAACQGNREACAQVCPLAFTLLDRADAIEPGYRYATWNRGVCLEGTGQLREALQAAEQSLSEYPDDPDMWALRAKVRIGLGYLDGACEDLARMFDLMGVTDELEAHIAPYGCRILDGVPTYVPTEEPGIRL